MKRSKGITVIVDLLLLTASILLVSAFWVYIANTNYTKSVETHTLDENIHLIIMSIDKSVTDAPVCTNVNIAIPKGYNITFYQSPSTSPMIAIINSGESPPSESQLSKLSLSLKKNPYINVLSKNDKAVTYDSDDTWFFNITFDHKIKLENNQSLTYKDSHLLVCSERGGDGTIVLSLKR